jgi:hypothetical protein
MPVVDAVIAIAQSDARDEWDRYGKLAPRVVFGNVAAPDAPRELLRARLQWVSYGYRGGSNAEASESIALENIFLERFVAALHSGRCYAQGVPHGGTVVTNIPAAPITVETIKQLRGDQWELAGTVWYGGDVIMGSPPNSDLRPEPSIALRPSRVEDQDKVASEPAPADAQSQQRSSRRRKNQGSGPQTRRARVVLKRLYGGPEGYPSRDEVSDVDLYDQFANQYASVEGKAHPPSRYPMPSREVVLREVGRK